MTILPAHHYQFSGLLTAIFCILLTILVSQKSLEKRLKRQFILYYAALFVWSSSLFICTSLLDYELSYFFCQLTHLGAIFIPVFFLHFTYAFLGIKNRISVFILTLFYSLAICFAAFCMFKRELFFGGISSKLSFPFFPNDGLLYTPWVISFALAVLIAHVVLAIAIPQHKGQKKHQILFFLIANMMGYLGGVGCFIPVYDFDYFPFPYGPYGVFLLSLVSGFTIFRFRFMSLDLILKNTIVFTVLFSSTVIIFSFFAFLFQQVLSSIITVNPFVVTAVTAFVVIASYEPLKKWLIELTDKHLFQKSKDIRVILNRLSENIVTVEILDIEEAGKNILYTLADLLRLESAALLVKNDDAGDFQTLNTIGVSKPDKTFEERELLLAFLKEKNKLINLENAEDKNMFPLECQEMMKLFKAVIAMPLAVQKDLIGVLFLGKKKSDQEFSRDELDYFPTIASQVSLALRNARLVDMERKTQAELAQQSKLAAIGTLSTGISHEIKNPLNCINMAASVLIMNEKDHFYDNLTLEEFKNEAFDAFNRIKGDVQRANDVIERLLGFARKPKSVKNEPMDIHASIEQAVKIVEKNFEEANVQIIKKYGDNLPRVIGDEHALAEAFLSLFINAEQAMKSENGTITISTALKGSEVQVDIQDNGEGIPKENLNKIFEPFFTTKDNTRNPDPKAVKGTGLGLFIVREIIKRCGGRITVTSIIHSGTTFHIFLPLAEKNE